MDDKATVLTEVCAALAEDRTSEAGAILRDRYPFVPLANVKRKYSVRQMLAIFIRDGFIDRYSGRRLVCPATLRLISKRLPEHFPFHSNWRFDACHFAYWELSPTIDHRTPVKRSGDDDESNWITTSMLRNAAKSVFTLDELGWSLHPPGDLNEWDGLTGWFVNQAKVDSAILTDPYLQQWYRVARENPYFTRLFPSY
jgi:hypothetical protein